MAWMDANEYFLIAGTARDRIDDLLSSTEIVIERAAISDHPGPTEPAHICDVLGVCARAPACLVGTAARPHEGATHPTTERTLVPDRT